MPRARKGKGPGRSLAPARRLAPAGGSVEGSVRRDPYRAKLIGAEAYAAKVALVGRLVVVLRGHVDRRRLVLIPQPSRAVAMHDVHELITTGEPGAAPGASVNRIAYLGFVAFQRGGVVLAGDEVRVGRRLVGRVAGYDLTHMPNHMNIVIAAPRAASGEDLGLRLGARVVIAAPGRAGRPPRRGDGRRS